MPVNFNETNIYLKYVIMKNKRLFIIILIIILLLLLSSAAMHFTDEVNWTLSDFVIAGVLLLGTGLTLEFVMRKVTQPQRRIAIILALLAILFLVWAELAVGIFGTPFAGN